MKRPSPCEVWRVISKERERERDFDIIQTLHLALACPVISVFELGLGSPYTSNRLSSVMKICYSLCLRYCKTLAQLANTQYGLLEEAIGAAAEHADPESVAHSLGAHGQ